jgi:hypothetical protein
MLSNAKMNFGIPVFGEIQLNNTLNSIQVNGNLQRLVSQTTFIDKLVNPLSGLGKFERFERNYKLESVVNSIHRLNAVVPTFDHLKMSGALHAVNELLKSGNAFSLINDQQNNWNKYLNSVLHHNGALTAIEQLTKSTPFADQINEISRKIQTAFSQTLSYAYESADTETIDSLESDQKVLDLLIAILKKPGAWLVDNAVEVVSEIKAYLQGKLITSTLDEKLNNLVQDIGIISFICSVLQIIYELINSYLP